MERGTPSDSLQRGFAPCTSLWNWQKECFLRSRRRDAHAEVQEETSCRGLGGVPQILLLILPPRVGDQRGLEEDSLEVL